MTEDLSPDELPIVEDDQGNVYPATDFQDAAIMLCPNGSAASIRQCAECVEPCEGEKWIRQQIREAGV